MSLKGKMVRALAGLLTKKATIVGADPLAPGFRRLTLRGDVPAPAPGDKLQILLPSDDVRTYTPVAGEGGVIELVGFEHAGGPGARWIASVAIGTEVLFAGPQRSLPLPDGPVTVVGDETSLGLAASFHRARPGQVPVVLQASSPADAKKAAEAMGLSAAIVVARGDTQAIVDAVLKTPDATVALSGGSELIVAVREALRARGVTRFKPKAYWTPGREGLD